MKATFLSVMILFCAQLLFAQKDNSLKDVPFKERIFTGGGIGMGFGSTQDYISISPVIGYRITEKFWGGTSFMLRYTKYKDVQPSITLIDYGINPFLRYTIFSNVFLQTEYEYLNYEYPVDASNSVREAFNSFLAGGGFFQPFGKNAGFYMMALYNFSYSEPVAGEYAPYYSPWVIRAGINVGF